MMSGSATDDRATSPQGRAPTGRVAGSGCAMPGRMKA